MDTGDPPGVACPTGSASGSQMRAGRFWYEYVRMCEFAVRMHSLVRISAGGPAGRPELGDHTYPAVLSAPHASPPPADRGRNNYSHLKKTF